jgi:hypothetical protein
MPRPKVTRQDLRLMLAHAVANTIGAMPPIAPASPIVAELRAKMIAAHPDKGGTEVAFIRARERYLEAVRAETLGRQLIRSAPPCDR